MIRLVHWCNHKSVEYARAVGAPAIKICHTIKIALADVTPLISVVYCQPYMVVNPPPPGLFLYPPPPGGGGGVGSDPPCYLENGWSSRNGRGIRKIFTRRFQITFENLKLRSRVRSRSGQRSKSGVFRLRTVETSNVSFFAQTFHMYSQGLDEGTD